MLCLVNHYETKIFIIAYENKKNITFGNTEIEKQYFQYNKQYTKVSSNEKNYKYFYRL